MNYCASACSADAVSATANSGYTFGSWGGGCCSFASTVSASTNAEVTATGTITAFFNALLTGATISATYTTIDSGQASGLSSTASFSGGTAPYTCEWLQKAPGAGSYTVLSGTSSFSCTSGSLPSTSTGTLSTTGTWSFELQVSDSSIPSQVVTSNVVSITVNAVLSAGTTTPSNPAIDTGESLTLTAHPSGGTGPLSYQWYTTASCTAGGAISGATGTTYLAAPTATTAYYFQVTDSSPAGAETSCSAADTVTVNPTLTAGTITPASPTIDSGESVTLTSDPSGGSTPYTYQWYTAAGCSTGAITGATAATYFSFPDHCDNLFLQSNR